MRSLLIVPLLVVLSAACDEAQGAPTGPGAPGIAIGAATTPPAADGPSATQARTHAFLQSCDACKPSLCVVEAADACYQLGLLYEQGQGGLPQDRSKAKGAWDKAAKAGNKAAREKMQHGWGGI